MNEQNLCHADNVQLCEITGEEMCRDEILMIIYNKTNVLLHLCICLCTQYASVFLLANT